MGFVDTFKKINNPDLAFIDHKIDEVARYCVLYLPLYKLPRDSFLSRDAYGHLCTVTGALWRLNGRSFDGTDDTILSATVPTTAINNWTIVAWLNPANLAQISMVVCNGLDDGVTGDGYAFGVGNGAGAAGNKLQGLLPGVSFLDSGYTFPAANRWYFVVMLRDAGVIKFFVDLIQTPNTFTNIPITPTEFRIGSQTGVRFFNGLVGEVCIYNRALTPLEIQHNYLATKWRYQ